MDSVLRKAKRIAGDFSEVPAYASPRHGEALLAFTTTVPPTSYKGRRLQALGLLADKTGSYVYTYFLPKNRGGFPEFKPWGDEMPAAELSPKAYMLTLSKALETFEGNIVHKHLQEIRLHLEEDEVRRAVASAEETLAECNLELEAETLEDFAEALEEITYEDIPLDERTARKKAGFLNKLGKLIRSGARAIGKAVGAAKQSVAADYAKGQARIAAVKNLGKKAKKLGKSVQAAYQQGQRQMYKPTPPKQPKRKLRPGEKMVFGRIVKVKRRLAGKRRTAVPRSGR